MNVSKLVVGTIKSLKLALLYKLLELLVSQLSPDMLRGVVDRVLDTIEDAIAKSETELDDKMLIPFIDTVRAAFNIPDNDEPVKPDEPDLPMEL